MRFTGTHLTIIICTIVVATTVLAFFGKITIPEQVVHDLGVAVVGAISFFIGWVQRQPRFAEPEPEIPITFEDK